MHQWFLRLISSPNGCLKVMDPKLGGLSIWLPCKVSKRESPKNHGHKFLMDNDFVHGWTWICINFRWALQNGWVVLLVPWSRHAGWPRGLTSRGEMWKSKAPYRLILNKALGRWLQMGAV